MFVHGHLKLRSLDSKSQLMHAQINASPDSKLSVLKRLNCVTGEAQLESSKSALTSLTTQVRKYLCNTGVLMWLQRHFDVTAERALNGESIDVGAHMSNAERSAPLFAHYGPPPAPAELPALPASGTHSLQCTHRVLRVVMSMLLPATAVCGLQTKLVLIKVIPWLALALPLPNAVVDLGWQGRAVNDA